MTTEDFAEALAEIRARCAFALEQVGRVGAAMAKYTAESVKIFEQPHDEFMQTVMIELLADPPLRLALETYAAIGPLRDCLDSLASNLALRHCGDAAGVYFPICADLDVFHAKRSKLSKKLSQADLDKIEAVLSDPVRARLLFGFHDRNNNDKHRTRLSTTGSAQASAGVHQGFGGLIYTYPTGVLEIGMPKGCMTYGEVEGLQYAVTVRVSFTSPPELDGHALMWGLHWFAGQVSSIIESFDPSIATGDEPTFA